MHPRGQLELTWILEKTTWNNCGAAQKVFEAYFGYWRLGDETGNCPVFAKSNACLRIPLVIFFWKTHLKLIFVRRPSNSKVSCTAHLNDQKSGHVSFTLPRCCKTFQSAWPSHLRVGWVIYCSGAKTHPMHSHKLSPVSCSCIGLEPNCVANVGQLAIFKEEKSMLGSQGNQLGLSGLCPV